MKTFKTWFDLVLVTFLATLLFGCAGNYNPKVNSSAVQDFMEVNQEEIGYLYLLFATSNNFTDDQLKVLNKGRYTIESVIEHVNKLAQTGGATYQDFKANFKLASEHYYLMKPILKTEVDSLTDIEPKIIFGNMVNRAEFFISECNRIINSAEDDIDARGFDNLANYGEGFYNALAPLIDMAL